MFARVYYGAHYVLDTLVGTTIGLTLGISWHYALTNIVWETSLLRVVWDWTMLFSLPMCLGLLGYELAMDRRVLRYRTLNEDKTANGNQIPAVDMKLQEELPCAREKLSEQEEGEGAIELEEVRDQHGILDAGEINVEETNKPEMESNESNEDPSLVEIPLSKLGNKQTMVHKENSNSSSLR